MIPDSVLVVDDDPVALGILSVLGLELWWMPHRTLRGTFWYLSLRVLVAYTWSFVLLLLVARELWKAPTCPDGH